MMSQETAACSSPFSALSYQEQQDRWLEWRSRQLDYQPADLRKTKAAEASAAPVPGARENLPTLRLPNMPIASPSRRRELEQVLSRHQKAVKRAGAFQPTAIG